MDQARAVEGLEWAMDSAAAAVLGGAVGFAVAKIVSAPGAAALAAASAAALLTLGALRRIGRSARTYRLPQFAPADHCGDVEELLLEHRIEPDPAPAGGELLLDDILEQIGPDSRVVRLFASDSLPKAGELKAAIDRQLAADARSNGADASQALHDALAELRRALR